MKTQKILGIASIALVGGWLASCDLLKDVTYEVTPSPLVLCNDSVEVTINATVPEKGMKKKAYVEFTPMLGNTALKKVAYQGEKATGNGKVIPKSGGRISYTDKVAYTPDMEVTSLMVKVEAYKGEGGKGPKSYDTDELVKGTIITALRVDRTGKCIAATDNFVRPTEHDTACMINFLKDRSEVRATELRDDDIKEMEGFITWALENPKIEMMNARSDGHASPEGEEERNQGLSQDRADNAAKAFQKIMKKLEFEAGAEEGFWTTQANGEDVAGFKQLLQAYDKEDTQIYEDKDVILRMLDNYKDDVDKEIKALAKTYRELEKEILPQLRRAKINIHYKNLGLTDDELKAVSKSDPDSLTVEQLLFTANLVDDLNEKLRLYNECIRQYPDDWRGHNNAGYILFLQGKPDEAKTAFQNAAGKDDNATVKNNMGVIHLWNNDRRAAMDLFEQATSAGSEVSYNMGIVNVMDCQYGEALGNFGSDNSYNKALAQVLNGDHSSAAATVDGSDDKETAQGYYLKAVAAARSKNQDMLINNLKAAIQKDANLKKQASTDMEFFDWWENDAFKALL